MSNVVDYLYQATHYLNALRHFQFQHFSDFARRFCGILRKKSQSDTSFSRLQSVWGAATRMIRRLSFSCPSTTFVSSPWLAKRNLNFRAALSPNGCRQ